MRASAGAARCLGEVASGKLDDQFPIDVFQTGSGTSSNMNANEVIPTARPSCSSGDRFAAARAIHPNDHVNMGQSTNDMFPTAIHVAVTVAIKEKLIPALHAMRDVLAQKAAEWDRVMKIGRTHFADATPLAVGPGGRRIRPQFALSIERAERAIAAVLELLPAERQSARASIRIRSLAGASLPCSLKRLAFHSSKPRTTLRRNAQRDGLVECHGAVASDRHHAFQCHEQPALARFRSALRVLRDQPARPPAGSSIMPAKVNPVMSESAMQVAARVMVMIRRWPSAGRPAASSSSTS